MLTKDKKLSFLEKVRKLLKEVVKYYREYSKIRKEEFFRSMSDEKLVDTMDYLDDEDFMIAYEVLEERYPKFL